MSEIFGKTIEGGPPEPTTLQRLQAFGGRLVTCGGRFGGQFINGTGSVPGHESQVNTPEFAAARIAVAEAIGDTFDLYYAGRLSVDREVAHKRPTKDTYNERLTIEAHRWRPIPKVTLEFNRPALLALLGQRERNISADAPVAKSSLIAGYAVSGIGPNGTPSYSVTLRDGWTQWAGFSELDWPEGDSRRYRRRVERVEPLLEIAQEVRDFNERIAA